MHEALLSITPVRAAVLFMNIWFGFLNQKETKTHQNDKLVRNDLTLWEQRGQNSRGTVSLTPGLHCFSVIITYNGESMTCYINKPILN